MGIDSPEKSLEVVLEAPKTTREMQWSCSWQDYINNTNQYGSIPLVSLQNKSNDTFGTTNGVKPVFVIDGIEQPDTATDNTGRTITYFYLINTDTAVNTARVQFSQKINSIVTKNIRYRCVMQPGDQLIYNEEGGWQVFDEDGAIKTTSSTITVNFVNNEVPAGPINSSNMVYTIAFTPITGSEQVFYNGQFIPPTYYTLVGTTLTLTFAPDTGMTLYISYRY